MRFEDDPRYRDDVSEIERRIKELAKRASVDCNALVLNLMFNVAVGFGDSVTMVSVRGVGNPPRPRDTRNPAKVAEGLMADLKRRQGKG